MRVWRTTRTVHRSRLSVWSPLGGWTSGLTAWQSTARGHPRCFGVLTEGDGDNTKSQDGSHHREATKRSNQAAQSPAAGEVYELYKSLQPLLHSGAVQVATSIEGAREGETEYVRAIRNSLLDAQDKRGVNLLHQLAVEQGRWGDVVTIARHLLAEARLSATPSERLYEVVERPNGGPTLRSLTENSIGHTKLEVATEHAGPRFQGTFDSLLDDDRHATINGLDPQQHRVLGVLWSALGTMTIACAQDHSISDGVVRPEILEILALFHHHGLISPSVYSYTHTDRQDAIQPPIVLHLLSTHIIAAISDAEVRAKDRYAIAEARAQGHHVSSMLLELRGASVRAHSEAIRPELWLELILWSCLHGRWTQPGFEILDVLCKQPQQRAWTAISWRANMRQAMPFNDASATDWDYLKFELDTRRGSRTDKSSFPGLNTQRTISNEVVTAYVDALCRHSGAIGLAHNVAQSRVVSRVMDLRRFLQRSGVALQNGSWSSTVQRLIDNDLLPHSSSADVQNLLAMSPKLGEEPEVSNTADLPEYVFDGNAALLGYLHRALKTQITAGNLSGADDLIKIIENCTSEARFRSVSDFFKSQQSRQLHGTSHSDFTFTSNFDGIEYPLFDSQIPLTTIAAYIDLLIDTKSFDRAKSIFSADDSESLFLPRRMWSDPNIAAALMRLASAQGDTEMLNRLLPASMRTSSQKQSTDGTTAASINAALRSYLETAQWRVAASLMLTMRRDSRMSWDPKCLAIAAKSLLVNTDHMAHDSSQLQSETDLGWNVFEAMLSDIETRDLSRKHRQNRSKRLFGILCILATVDERFMRMLARLTDLRAFYCPTIDIFNTIIETTAQVNGNRAARKLFEDLADLPPTNLVPRYASSATTPRPGYRRGLSSDYPLEILAADGTLLTARSRVEPTLSTIRLIVQHGVDELRQSTTHDVSGLVDVAQDETTSELERLRSWAEKMLFSTDRVHSPDTARELDTLFEDIEPAASDR